MSLEVFFEKDLSERDLKILLYENFQFEFK